MSYVITPRIRFLQFFPHQGENTELNQVDRRLIEKYKLTSKFGAFGSKWLKQFKKWSHIKDKEDLKMKIHTIFETRAKCYNQMRIYFDTININCQYEISGE